ncbi:major facilitator superfamily domain-containing protein 6-like isoform X2 [Paramacrobiotus metropolitanus]|nr:major facilitator superfamily domain-containing protein 6-like isoform X2 [Paramacrobiotus metropolitanus]
MAALYPYLTIHMKSLGLTITETAIVYALLPILCFAGPAIAGAVADKLGYYKVILVGAILVNIGLHTLMYFGVPLYENKNITQSYNSSRLVASTICKEDYTVLPIVVNATVLQYNFDVADYNESSCQTANSTTIGFDSLDLSSCESRCPFYWYRDINNGDASVNFTCPVAAENITSVQNNSSTVESSCWIKCRMAQSFPVLCTTHIESGNRQTTFWLYFVFRVLASIALAAVFPLMDAATIQMSEEYHGNIGMQRMYSLLGMCAMAPLAGLLMDRLNMGYAPAFYLYDAMHVLAAITAGIMSLTVRLPADNIWKNVGQLMRNPRIVVFIFVVFFIGAAWGLLDSFFFWFMEEDLHSPKWLLGLTNTVGGLCGVPVMASATRLIKRFGHTNILIFSMFVYGGRYIGYSYVYNPYMVLPLEAFEAITNSLMWVTATIYAGKIAPQYLATLQGIVGGMHYGIGRGAGALIGGLMIRAVGARVAWRIFGVVCFGCGFVYAALQFFWLRKVPMPTKTDRKLSTGLSSQPTLDFRKSLSLREIHPMAAEDEQKLEEIAMLNVLKATSGGVTGSIVSLHHDADVDAQSDHDPYFYQKGKPSNANDSSEQKHFEFSKGAVGYRADSDPEDAADEQGDAEYDEQGIAVYDRK